MKLAIRGLLILLAGFFLLMGVRWMLTPEPIAEQFRISALDSSGVSAQRSVLAGMFLGLGSLLALRLSGRTLDGFLAVAVFEGFVVVGRLVSLAVDGSSPEVLTALAVECVAVVSLLVAHRVLGKSTR